MNPKSRSARDLAVHKRRVMVEFIRLAQAPIQDADKLWTQVSEYVASIGMPESDARWFYNKMLRDGWKFGGIPVDNWKEFLNILKTQKFFPSFRKKRVDQKTEV